MTPTQPPARCTSAAAPGRWTSSPPEHLRAWLHARRTRWPATANPHLLINQSTGGGTGPVNRDYIQQAMRRAGITARDLRADRLHDEAHASGGDPLQLTHLFGISDPAAIRYCAQISRIEDGAGLPRA